MLVRGMGGNFAGQDFQVNGSLVFGRSPQGCNVLFPDNVRGVSRTHCKVDVAGGGATLTDMGSSYGTFLNGRKLAPYTPTPLNNGDTFWLGDQSNSFSFMGAPAVQSMQMNAQPMNMAMPQMNAQPVYNNAPPKKISTGLIIGIAIAAVIIIVLIILLISQQAQINEFNNRGPIDKIIDGVEGIFEIVN